MSLWSRLETATRGREEIGPVKNGIASSHDTWPFSILPGRPDLVSAEKPTLK